MLAPKKNLVSMVSESYVTDGTLDQYDQYPIGDQAQIDGLIVELDAHEEASRQLQAVQAVIQQDVEEGLPLSQGAAHMVGVVVESIHSRVLKSTYQNIVPSLENFESSSKKHIATRICLEGIVETVKKVAMKIVEIIQNIWTRIKEFFSSMFSRKEQLKTDLDKVAKKAAEIPGEFKASGDKLSLTVSTERYNSSGDEAILMHKIPFGIASHCDGESTRRIIDDTSILITSNREIILHIVECLKNVEDSPVDYHGLRDGVYKLVDEIKHRLARLEMKSKKMQGNKVFYVYGHLVDSQSCQVKEITGLEDNSDIPRIFNLDVSICQPDNVPIYHPRILKREEMSKLAVSSIKLIEQSQNLDKVIPIVEKVLKKNLELLRSKINMELEKNPQELPLAINAVKDLFRYISHNLPKLSSDASKVASGVKHYIVLSAQHYKKP